MINVSEIESRMRVRGMTAGTLALRLSRRSCRVTEREIRDILSGRVVPSWDHLVRLSILLDCTPWDLIIKKET